MMTNRTALQILLDEHPVRTVYNVHVSIEYPSDGSGTVFRFTKTERSRDMEGATEVVFFARHIPREEYLACPDDCMMDLYKSVFNEAHRQLKIQEVGEA
jgi:hypothetical protein